MAYKDSGALSIGQSYQLGEYVFSITVSHDPGESETGINVRCDKGDERAVVSGEVMGTVESWSVEANETEASVYVVITDHSSIPAASIMTHTQKKGLQSVTSMDDGRMTQLMLDQRTIQGIFASKTTGAKAIETRTNTQSEGTHTYVCDEEYTINGKTVYYKSTLWHVFTDDSVTSIEPLCDSNDPVRIIAWRIIYGNIPLSLLIARFAIDLHAAGGTGPDSDWEDPGDHDEERDPDEPPTTLFLQITGASAGAHDTEAPPAPEQQQVYGSGGNGGNGGGGGAGASTVIVYKFPTERADKKEITATARGPGVGSKSSPGGKGSDGCILIFY